MSDLLSHTEASQLLNTALKMMAEKGAADSEFSKMIGFRYFAILGALQKISMANLKTAVQIIASPSAIDRMIKAEQLSPSSLALSVAIVGLNETDDLTEEKTNRFIYLLANFPSIIDSAELQRCLETDTPWIQECHAIADDKSTGLGADKSSDDLYEGRIRTIRAHKKTIFIDIITHDTKVQLMFDRAGFPSIDEDMNIGDYIQVHGTPGVTQRSADCIIVKSVEGFLQSHSNHSEEIVNEWEASAKKFLTFNRVRDFFSKSGFTEVRTPIISNSFQGGLSKPFVTFENARGLFGFLKVTSEIDMLKMIAGGARRIFEFTTSFRNEGLKGRSAIEFPFFECYSTEQTMPQMCDTMTKLLSDLSGKDLTPHHVDFAEAFKGAAGFEHTDRPQCESWLAQKGIKIDFARSSHDRLMERMLESCIQPQLPELTFLKSMPIGGSPLIKGERESANRAWVIFRGHEIAEIAENETDHNLLLAKLSQQFTASTSPLPRDYRQFLDHIAMGLPQTVGIGLGLDRLHECLKNG